MAFVHFGSFFTLICCSRLLSTTLGQIDSGTLSFNIYEQFPAPFFVGDIAEKANLKARLNASVFENLRYSILTEGNEHARYFDVGSNDGVLKTKEAIDRDFLCPQMEECILNLDVATQGPHNHIEVIKIAVTISDRNDNAPQFLQSQLSKSISESTLPGYSFAIPTADDIDSPQYGVKSYVMSTPSQLFELKVANNDDGTVSNLYIVLLKSLDREERDGYQLTVEAKDGGSPPLTGALNVEVVVLDINDNFPQFDSDSYVAEVREDTAPGTVIYQVGATDPDSGANGELVYSFDIKTVHSYGSLFSIKNTTGEISVISDLDFEQTKTCNLQVTAHDRGVQTLLAETRVVVNVLDVNDNPPKITVNALTASRQVEIPESSPVGSFAAYISVNDPDEGENGQFNCVLSDPSGSFRVEPQRESEFKLVTTTRLDHELSSDHLLEFTCQDKGNTPLTSMKQLKVTVLDENDNTPQFSKQSNAVILLENNIVGQEVIQVTATDADSGKNGEVLYSLVGDAGNFFHINPINGNITAVTSFDYEKNHNYTLQVAARDQGEEPLSSVAIVYITILDENDNPPRFRPTYYDFFVVENQDIGTEVGRVLAYDQDSLGYDKFYFSLPPGSVAIETFAIEPTSGRIFTTKPLDRELVSNYDVTVLVTDENKPSLVSSATVSVTVTDLNDESPYVVFPSPSNNTIQISNKVPVGYIATQIYADDMDEMNHPNSQLQYTLREDSGGKGVFSIDKDTATIKVLADLSKVNKNFYSLKILIQDKGEPPLATDTTLNIVVNKSLSFPRNGNVGSSKGPIITGQNLTIVIAVAVVSAVLIVILMVTIIILCRQDRKRRQRNYLNVLFGDQAKLADPVNRGETPGQADSQNNHKLAVPNKVALKNKNIPLGKNKDGSFCNKIDINDEQSHRVSRVPSAVQENQRDITDNEAVYARSSKQTHPGDGPRGSSHLAAGRGPTAPGYWGHSDKDYQHYLVTETGDDLSEPSDVSLNSDSGRGSNEDPESRSSSLETAEQQRFSQGDSQPRPLYQHSPQGGLRHHKGVPHHSSPNQRQYGLGKVSMDVSHIDNRHFNGESQARLGAQGMPPSHTTNSGASHPNTRAHHVASANSYQGNKGNNRSAQRQRSVEGVDDDVFYISSNASHV